MLNLVPNRLVHVLKDKPLLVQNFKSSCRKSKIRKPKINFRQNFNLVTSLMPKMSSFLDCSSLYYLTFLCQCLKIRSIILNVSNYNEIERIAKLILDKRTTWTKVDRGRPNDSPPGRTGLNKLSK